MSNDDESHNDYGVNNWTKFKWDHTGSTSFQIKKESSKSVHPVESSEISSASSIYGLDKEIQELVNKIDQRTSSQNIELYPGTERIDYDFEAERRNMYSTNLVESTAHLFKGCLGSGILAIHEAFMDAGLWTSLGASLCIGFISAYNMLMLVKSAQKMYVLLRVPKLSYPDLAEVSLAVGPIKCCRRYSKIFRYTVDVLIFVHMNSVCCIYQIIIARTLKQALENVSQTIEEYHMADRIYLLVVTIPLLVLCLIKNLKYLAPFSIIADVFIAVSIITSLYYSITAMGHISERPAWKSISGLMHFCGIFAYSIDGMSLALPIENNMKNPKYFQIVVAYAMSFVVPFVSCVGFFGYWGWGESCQSPITSHMPNSLGTIILQFLLVVVLCVSFAVHFWVPFRIIWHYVGIKFKRKNGSWERIFRTIQVFIVAGISIAFPNLNNLISFVGNFLLAFIIFIIPAFIEAMVTWKENRRKRWKLLKNLFITAVGVFMICSALGSRVLPR